jgi:uncharacterized protein
MDEMTPPTNTLAPATITQPSPIKRVVLLTVGWLSIALAIVGIPLPVLPTTPFLILAAACFVRTSPRLHERLLSDKRFGPLLAQWQARRSIPRYAKRRAYLLIVVTFSLSIAMVDVTGLRVMLGCIALGVISFLASLKTEN